MPSEKRRIYWDAPVWLSYINGDEDRLPTLDALLADSASDKGGIQLYTSVVSQVEVAFAKTEQDNQALDHTKEQEIDKLWADRDAVKLVELYDAITQEARGFIRLAITRGWRLKPMDAIHLATAKAHSCEEFHTYDARLLKYSNNVGFPIVPPHTIQPRLFDTT
ncbi:MAG: PIN domain-containing protein [Chloroflexi bacterium]|nr:PIN domain-containing protein [Chloroflexota bacterium]